MMIALARFSPTQAASVGRQISGRMQQQGRDEGQDDVDAGAGEGDPDHVAFGMVEAAEVDRHRLGVAEQEGRVDQQQQAGQDQGPERIDVLDRVEGDPAHQARGIVAAALGHPAMRGLMQRDRDHDRQQPDRERLPDRSDVHGSGAWLEGGFDGGEQGAKAILGGGALDRLGRLQLAKRPQGALSGRAFERSGRGQHVGRSRRSGRCSGARDRSRPPAPPRSARRACRRAPPCSDRRSAGRRSRQARRGSPPR